MPNIRWDGDKTYVPPTIKQRVDGFGIDDEVDVLPFQAPTITVTRTVTNDSTVAVPGGYTIEDTVVRWVFVGASGWRPGDPTTHTIATATAQGPALRPGQSAPVTLTFTLPANTSCGLFGETLSLDTGGAIAESSETDNESLHLFFVPGTMRVNLGIAPPGLVEVPHTAAASVTHTWTATPATPGTSYWLFGRTPRTGGAGSVGTIVPAPAGGGPAAALAAVAAMTYRIDGKTHSLPATDILREVHVEPLNGKLTAITTDGCSVRQQTAPVNVLHQ